MADLKYWGDDSGTGMGQSGGDPIVSALSTVGTAAAASGGNPWLTAASVALPVLGGIFGGNADRDAANANMNYARQVIGGVEVPELKEWLLQNYASAGNFTPEMLETLQLGNTAQEGIPLNPQERMQQETLLKKMLMQAETGNTPEDMAAYELANRQTLGQNNAMQGQIMQNIQSRGHGGSGIELAQRLAAQQQSADALQKAHLQQAAQQNALRLQAAQASMGALGNLRSQNYQQQLNLANAQDQRSMANWQNQQGIMNQNTGNLNDAQKFNLANRQRLMDNNTQLSNQAYMYNNGARQQQQYAMEMQKAQAMAGQATQAANQQYNQAGQTAGMWSGIGQGIGTILTDYNNKKA